MEDLQATLQIMRLSSVTRLNFLLRALPPALTKATTAEYDSLIQWALPTIVEGSQDSMYRFPSPHEVDNIPTEAGGAQCSPRRQFGRRVYPFWKEA